jgi:ribosomal protein S18 acetylase RimI-like enzyme
MDVIIREAARDDREPVRGMLIECGAFSDEEVRVALEVLDAGFEGDYATFVAAVDGVVRAYICVGQTPLTRATWHLYWLCTHPAAQRQGLARALERYAGDFVAGRGGERLIVETSGRPDYDATRRFYEGAGYHTAGRIADYYKHGDDCVLYCRVLNGHQGRRSPSERP